MKDEKKKGGLILSPETIVILKDLKGEDKNRFIDCIIDYHENGTTPNESVCGAISTFFKVFRMTYDYNQKKYDEKCEKLRNNARSKRANASKSNQKQADASKSKQIESNNNNNNNVTNVTNISIIEDKSSLSDCSDEAPIDFDKFIKCWNDKAENCNLRPIKYLTDKRKSHLKARLKECVRLCNGDVDKAKSMLFDVITNASDSEFLNSKCPQFGNFDWIFCKPNNFVKVMEGNYN